jgi:hypothetical protein
MAIVTGGLHGSPKGKLAGITYGAARTREGKVVTARQKVSPSNPNTSAQQAQRNAFSDAKDITRSHGPTIYTDVWNRAVGQLPGFQSMMSYYLNNIDSSGDISVPSDLSLGDLHFPNTFSFATGGAAGEVDLSWSTETGSNGTNSDTITWLAVPKARADRDSSYIQHSATATTRSAGSLTISGLKAATTYIISVYFEGAGTAADNYTLVRSSEVNSG